ncbi:TatD family deoxyribonuclease [Psychromonas sp. RZ22]|uniref:TatD family hydrolase n=1 Tax=Psychromonas algarum TaxID=2555643 RepID=UPI0010675343|nr:TatD family hydrolase [Psychromonas sp. RZ22]TEW53499.1 TatD family deoxyribonuclease [Psychromonas sp. RZ22]
MFIDSHCHFNFACFNTNRKLLMSQLIDSNISHIVIPGTDAKRWAEIIKLAENNHNIYFSLGIHPHFLRDFDEQDLTYLKELLLLTRQQTNSKCVALGEIGLDKLIETDLIQQEAIFLAQLALAQSLKLPVILHIVKTQSRVLALLKQSKFNCGGIYHAFSGSEEIANEFIKLGFKLGVGGVITYPNSTKTKQTISRLPLNSLVLETDAPDMPIYKQNTLNNSPLNLKIIFNELCKLRKEPIDVIERELYLNCQSIFSIIND